MVNSIHICNCFINLLSLLMAHVHVYLNIHLLSRSLWYTKCLTMSNYNIYNIPIKIVMNENYQKSMIMLWHWDLRILHFVNIHCKFNCMIHGQRPLDRANQIGDKFFLKRQSIIYHFIFGSIAYFHLNFLFIIMCSPKLYYMFFIVNSFFIGGKQ